MSQRREGELKENLKKNRMSKGKKKEVNAMNFRYLDIFHLSGCGGTSVRANSLKSQYGPEDGDLLGFGMMTGRGADCGLA